MIHKVFFQISKWFSNNIQILFYKYQKITFKSFQRVVYSTDSSWKYSKKIFSQIFLTIFFFFFFAFNSTPLFDIGAIIQPSPLHFINEKKRNCKNCNTSYKMSFCTCTLVLAVCKLYQFSYLSWFFSWLIMLTSFLMICFYNLSLSVFTEKQKTWPKLS